MNILPLESEIYIYIIFKIVRSKKQGMVYLGPYETPCSLKTDEWRNLERKKISVQGQVTTELSNKFVNTSNLLLLTHCHQPLQSI